MKGILLFLLISLNLLSFSQISEDFSDGNISANPSWLGDDSVFVVQDDGTGNFQLKSNKLITNISYFLASESTQISDGLWEMDVKLSFNTSSTNYVDVFLTANQSNLLSSTLTSYFVRIGGTNDEICFYKKVNGTNTLLIDGINGVTNSSASVFRLKVSCDATNTWKLEHDFNHTGTFTSEGEIQDASINSSAFFGILIRQSTASFFQKHFFDNIYVGPVIQDTIPPDLVGIEVLSDSQILAEFSEELGAGAGNTQKYSFLPSLLIASATIDATNSKKVKLILNSSLQNGNSYTLICNQIPDTLGNESVQQERNFTYLVFETPSKGDVIITEFMADPSPRVALPELEFVEIHNVSDKFFNLTGWKLGDNATFGTVLNRTLFPGEYVILCPTSAVDSFPNAVGVTSFPSLNNSGDDIVLLSNNLVEIDQIRYTDSWYLSDVKKEGGYSLERIKTIHPCSSSSNWKASESINGGTPGAQNSIHDNSPDTEFPQLLSLLVTNPNKLQLLFNEPLDSLALSQSIFTSNPYLNIATRSISGLYPTEMTLDFQESFTPSTQYNFTLLNIKDCWQNATTISGKFLIDELPEAGDLIINEILFDPIVGGSDYVEVKNKSQKWIDVYNCSFAKYDDDTIASIKAIPIHFILKPNEILAFTPDSTFQFNHFPMSQTGRFVQMSLPTYPNDSATVYLLCNSKVIDKVSYQDDWHFKLLDSPDGKSLERISASGNSDDSGNWHTAAEAINFGTPGAENSQNSEGNLDLALSFTKEIFSPDLDGVDDVLQLNYVLNETGYLGNITLFDERGRLVKTLMKNELLGLTGSITWDGINDQEVKASIGTYVLFFEVFNIHGGAVFQKRKAFVLAGKF